MATKPNSKKRLKTADRKAVLSFYPEKSAYETLKRLSKKTRVPQQAYLREGLDWIIKEKYAKELRP
jgi:hypothetical protein